MRKVILYCGLGLLSISPSFASDALTMQELLNSTNPLLLLKKEATNNPRNADLLCQEIKKETFYDLAQGAKFGVIKRSELISYCSGTEFEAKIKNKVVSVTTRAGGFPPMGPPPIKRPPMGPPNAVGVDAGLGNNIVLADVKRASLKQFKANVVTTVAANAAGIQDLINTNTNRALDVQNALTALVSKGAQMLPNAEILNAAYAVYTAPVGTSNKLMRDRASSLLRLDLAQLITVNTALKAIFP